MVMAREERVFPGWSFRPAKGGSGVRLGFAEAGDAVAVVPLAAFLEGGDALEALEDIAFGLECAGAAEAAML
jgi:hypothetical protein